MLCGYSWSLLEVPHGWTASVRFRLRLTTNIRFYEITLLMDPLPHALASYSIQRAAFPRISRAATVPVVLTGMIADADLLRSYFGPSAYLAFDRTYFHSLLAALVFSLFATLPFFFLKPKGRENPISRATIFAAALAASLLHLVLDLCQSAGVEILWPFSTRRFALDWVSSLDL